MSAVSASPPPTIPSKRSHHEVDPTTPPESGSLDENDQQQATDQPTRSARPVTFKVQYGKDVHELTADLSDKVSELKATIEKRTGVHANLQKLLYKGNLKDDQTLEEAKVVGAAKIILMASKVEDVLKITSAKAGPTSTSSPLSPATPKEAWSEQTEHKKILGKGKPDDAEEGTQGKKVTIPARGVTGLLNRIGQKTRLTFKTDSEEVWIGTAERTQKVPFNTIRAVTSQPIKGNEGYHIVGLQLGPTDKSNYWLYWVPAQYVEAIKDAVLGQWQPFGF
ncbi:hypothetical protein M427DRAFT_42652 [Gonapodya prolifera JEL478]|uniref:Ubiquitin-like domain-containing protein n=1 Tax=Gonapodya prolifera (strain JEL478) TaxID=1344416 RepID=A0A139AND9_GONPJ|nr:hypothetical protein M427DRAFT_42652 [Gonapodya prolifera JEL478]|eukprot:KXS18259.1 hypothetical protein M427DRAFT_42652 [Gonapodya prolifera JEL478]